MDREPFDLARYFQLLFLVVLSIPLFAQNVPTKTAQHAYKKWLDEDVRWIITGRERADFKKLTTDEQRDNFIEAFWERRNPTPGSPENRFKEEHYRRLAYAIQHFAEGMPGWRSDRGRIYIVHGPPDKVEHENRPGTGGVGSQYEVWHYRHIDGIAGHDLEIAFRDTCGCGEYQLTYGPEEDPHVGVRP